MKNLPPGVVVLLTGLCPLIPFPFIDDWLIARLRRHLLRERLAVAGVCIEPGEVAALAADPGITFKGCLWAIVIWPVKKLVRMVLFFLMFKTCVDTAAETVHRLRLVDDAVAGGWLPGECGRVVSAIAEVLTEETPSPVRRALRREFHLSTVDGEDQLARIIEWLHLQGGGKGIRERFTIAMTRPPEPTPEPDSVQSTPTV